MAWIKRLVGTTKQCITSTNDETSKITKTEQKLKRNQKKRQRKNEKKKQKQLEMKENDVDSQEKINSEHDTSESREEDLQVAKPHNSTNRQRLESVPDNFLHEGERFTVHCCCGRNLHGNRDHGDNLRYRSTSYPDIYKQTDPPSYGGIRHCASEPATLNVSGASSGGRVETAYSTGISSAPANQGNVIVNVTQDSEQTKTQTLTTAKNPEPSLEGKDQSKLESALLDLRHYFQSFSSLFVIASLQLLILPIFLIQVSSYAGDHFFLHYFFAVIIVIVSGNINKENVSKLT